MQYRITVKEIIPPDPADCKAYPKEEEIYGQVVDDLDLSAIIAAANPKTRQIKII